MSPPVQSGWSRRGPRKGGRAPVCGDHPFRHGRISGVNLPEGLLDVVEGGLVVLTLDPVGHLRPEGAGTDLRTASCPTVEPGKTAAGSWRILADCWSIGETGFAGSSSLLALTQPPPVVAFAWRWPSRGGQEGREGLDLRSVTEGCDELATTKDRLRRGVDRRQVERQTSPSSATLVPSGQLEAQNEARGACSTCSWRIGWPPSWKVVVAMEETSPKPPLTYFGSLRMAATWPTPRRPSGR